jgi:hypothetical protein
MGGLFLFQLPLPATSKCLVEPFGAARSLAVCAAVCELECSITHREAYAIFAFRRACRRADFVLATDSADSSSLSAGSALRHSPDS